jgi:hypothetical protein
MEIGIGSLIWTAPPVLFDVATSAYISVVRVEYWLEPFLAGFLEGMKDINSFTEFGNVEVQSKIFRRLSWLCRIFFIILLVSMLNNVLNDPSKPF